MSLDLATNRIQTTPERPVFFDSKYVAPVSSKPDKKTKKKFRPLEEIQWRAAVADAMRSFGATTDDPDKWNDRADKYENCSLNPKAKFNSSFGNDLPEGVESVMVCPTNKRHDAVVFCASCDNRGCADCAGRYTARFVSRFAPVAHDLLVRRNVGERLRHVILTTPVSLQDPDVKTKMDKYFNLVHECLNMVQRSFIRKNSKHHKETEKRLGKRVRTAGYNWKDRGGAIVSAEFGEDGRKLHFHIEHYGEFINRFELSTWLKYLSGGESEIVWLRGITTEPKEAEKEIIETVKYSTKFFKSHVNEDGTISYQFIEPELMPKLMATLDGSRRVRSYGVFYGIQEPEKEKLCCEQCDSQLVRLPRELWSVYSSGGYKAVQFFGGSSVNHPERSSLNSITANNSENSGVKIRGRPPDKPEKPPPKQEKLL